MYWCPSWWKRQTSRRCSMRAEPPEKGRRKGKSHRMRRFPLWVQSPERAKGGRTSPVGTVIERVTTWTNAKTHWRRKNWTTGGRRQPQWVQPQKWISLHPLNRVLKTEVHGLQNWLTMKSTGLRQQLWNQRWNGAAIPLMNESISWWPIPWVTTGEGRTTGFLKCTKNPVTKWIGYWKPPNHSKSNVLSAMWMH